MSTRSLLIKRRRELQEQEEESSSSRRRRSSSSSKIILSDTSIFFAKGESVCFSPGSYGIIINVSEDDTCNIRLYESIDNHINGSLRSFPALRLTSKVINISKKTITHNIIVFTFEETSSALISYFIGIEDVFINTEESLLPLITPMEGSKIIPYRRSKPDSAIGISDLFNTFINESTWNSKLLYRSRSALIILMESAMRHWNPKTPSVKCSFQFHCSLEFMRHFISVIVRLQNIIEVKKDTHSDFHSYVRIEDSGETYVSSDTHRSEIIEMNLHFRDLVSYFGFGCVRQFVSMKTVGTNYPTSTEVNAVRIDAPSIVTINRTLLFMKFSVSLERIKPVGVIYPFVDFGSCNILKGSIFKFSELLVFLRHVRKPSSLSVKNCLRKKGSVPTTDTFLLCKLSAPLPIIQQLLNDENVGDIGRYLIEIDDIESLNQPTPLDGLMLLPPKLLIPSRNTYATLNSDFPFSKVVSWWLKVIENDRLSIEGCFENVKQNPIYTSTETLQEVLNLLKLDSTCITNNNVAKTNLQLFHSRITSAISEL